eukprot:scaffold57302_cov36-Tisochrysis_lutea.AAC.1
MGRRARSRGRSTHPKVVILQQFLSEDEAQRLARLRAEHDQEANKVEISRPDCGGGRAGAHADDRHGDESRWPLDLEEEEHQQRHRRRKRLEHLDEADRKVEVYCVPTSERARHRRSDRCEVVQHELGRNEVSMLRLDEPHHLDEHGRRQRGAHEAEA